MAKKNEFETSTVYAKTKDKIEEARRLRSEIMKVKIPSGAELIDLAIDAYLRVLRGAKKAMVENAA